MAMSPNVPAIPELPQRSEGSWVKGSVATGAGNGPVMCCAGASRFAREGKRTSLGSLILGLRRGICSKPVASHTCKSLSNVECGLLDARKESFYIIQLRISKQLVLQP